MADRQTPGPRRRPRTGLLLLLAIAAVRPLPAHAQPPPSPAPPATVEERLTRLEKLLAETRAELAAAKAAPATASDARLKEIERQIDVLTKEIEALRLGEAASPVNAPEHYGLGPAASKVYARKGVSIGGYGNVLYQNFSSTMQNGEPSGAVDTIDLQRVVLYVGYRFSDQFVLDSEIEYEHAVTAGDKEGEVEVEFAFLDWTRSRALNLRAGLVLIPVGILNEQHEPTTFFGARRNDVETYILPTTWREIGAGTYGSTELFTWRAYAVNGLNASGYSAGAGIREGSQEGSLAKAQNFAFTARLDASPLPGLLVGASVFTGDSAQGLVDSTGQPFGALTTTWDVHAEFRFRGLSLRGLYAGVSIADAAQVNQANGYEGDQSVGSSLNGWYLVGGFDVLSLVAGSRMSLSPYVRYEEYDTQASVPAGYIRNPANDVNILTTGLQFKPIEQIVLSAEWQKIGNAARTGTNQWNLGLGWIF
jgi:hypothetical protein